MRRGLLWSALVALACIAREATAEDWTDQVTSVKDLRRNLTLSFDQRASLLFGQVGGVIGGTGRASAPLTYIECDDKGDCFPQPGNGDFVAVVEEDLLATLLPKLAASASPDGTPASVPIPAAILALPGDPAAPNSPAPRVPLAGYGASTSTPWNPGGHDLLRLTLPCGVFLAPEALAAEIRAKAKRNVARGWKGPAYHGRAELVTRMSLESTSVTCLEQGECEPLGGFTVWASMPPQPPPSMLPAPPREAVIVLTHWDSLGLFRSITAGAHAALSGLISTLVAADALSRGAGRGSGYARDVLFVSLAGEAFDLMGSRRLLYDLAAAATGAAREGVVNATAAFNLTRAVAILEVGMTAAPPPPGANRSALYAHAPAGASALRDALLAAGSSARGGAEVRNASAPGLPPSSSLLWHTVAPDVDAAYLGDFDAEFANRFYFSHRDTGGHGFSAASIAAAGAAVARAVHALAARPGPAGGAAQLLDVDMAAAQALTDELIGCLVSTGGYPTCPLVQDMTSVYDVAKDGYVGVLHSLQSDPQRVDVNNMANIERFTWEFLANRTFAGQAHAPAGSDAAGCDPDSNVCAEGEVCLHFRPSLTGDAALGACVNATARYVPSLSTKVEYELCEGEAAASDCRVGWRVDVGGDPGAWEARLGLPVDPIPTETYNEPIYVHVNLAEPRMRDDLVLALGFVVTAAVCGAVLLARMAFRRSQVQYAPLGTE